jgi:hypothetical protein
MGSLLKTLWGTTILKDAAYQEWRERPNIFLRGIVLIVVISLVAGLIAFAVNLVNQVRPVDVAGIQEGFDQWRQIQSQFFPAMEDPEAQAMMEGIMDVVIPMVRDISEIPAPLPRGIVGFFNALGSWLTRVLAAITGWLVYGALVLIFANLLGGAAKLPEFLGTVAVYAVPGLLALLQPLPCVGCLLGLIATIWVIVVYIKATSVVTGLDTGRAIVAVVAPFLSIIVLGFLLTGLVVLWFAILF